MKPFYWGIAALLAALIVMWLSGPAEIDSGTQLPSGSDKSAIASSSFHTEVQYVSEPNPELETGPEREEDNTAAEVIGTLDQSKKYHISLPELEQKSTLPQKSYVLYGKVNGSKFKLKIPTSELEQSHDVLTLRVETVGTREVVTTQVGFVDMLADVSKKHQVDLYTDDIDNYVYSQEEAQKLPGQ